MNLLESFIFWVLLNFLLVEFLFIRGELLLGFDGGLSKREKKLPSYQRDVEITLRGKTN